MIIGIEMSGQRNMEITLNERKNMEISLAQVTLHF